MSSTHGTRSKSASAGMKAGKRGGRRRRTTAARRGATTSAASVRNELSRYRRQLTEQCEVLDSRIAVIDDTIASMRRGD